MKKRNFLFVSSLLLTLGMAAMVGCGPTDSGGSGEGDGGGGTGPGGGGSGGGGGGGGDPTPQTFNQTYYFFLDYSHSDESNPFKKVQWYRGQPLGSVPEGCSLTSENASDPLFPVFLGWSEYSSSLDDSKLWNFATDFKQTQTVYLYGIWVAND